MNISSARAILDRADTALGRTDKVKARRKARATPKAKPSSTECQGPNKTPGKVMTGVELRRHLSKRMRHHAGFNDPKKLHIK